MSDENLEKIYVIKTKSVSSFVMTQSRKNAGGGKMKVSSIMLLKTNVVKMSEMRLSIILMKIKLVIGSSPLCL
jgi:hypothetical protein